MSNAMPTLQQATQDLLFPSESDFPVVPIEWPKNAPPPTSAPALLSARGRDADTPVQTLDFDAFFAPKTEQNDEQDERQRKTAGRLKVLSEVLKAELTDLRVYKVGSLNFDVFVLGRDEQGQWRGVSTQIVET